MSLRFDWKFLLSIFVAIASVGVPVWLWQTDQTARSLKLDVVSQTSLNPISTPALTGLKLSLEGQELSDAYLTVLELTNSGSKPILQADFESSIQIFSALPSKIVRVEVGDVVPQDLKPSIALEGGQIVLQPLLLNPGDLVRITVLSDSGKPRFDSRIRVAGITKMSLNEISVNRSWMFWVETLVGFLLVTFYVHLFFEFLDSLFKMRFDWITLSVALTCGIGGSFLIIRFGHSYSLPFWQFGIFVAAMVAVTTPLKKMYGAKR